VLDPVRPEVENFGVRSEFADDLAACPARRAGHVAIIYDCDCTNSHLLGSKGSNCRKDRRAFGTVRESIRGVLDIASVEDLSAREQDCSADPEVRIRSIGVFIRMLCHCEQFVLLGLRD